MTLETVAFQRWFGYLCPATILSCFFTENHKKLKMQNAFSDVAEAFRYIKHPLSNRISPREGVRGLISLTPLFDNKKTGFEEKKFASFLLQGILSNKPEETL